MVSQVTGTLELVSPIEESIPFPINDKQSLPFTGKATIYITTKKKDTHDHLSSGLLSFNFSYTSSHYVFNNKPFTTNDVPVAQYSIDHLTATSNVLQITRSQMDESEYNIIGLKPYNMNESRFERKGEIELNMDAKTRSLLVKSSMNDDVLVTLTAFFEGL